MNQQQAAVLQGHRQGVQKPALVSGQLRVGPARGAIAQGARHVGRVDGHVVMVALDHQGAVAGQILRALHHRDGVSAITHEVAQNRKLACAPLARMAQAGIHALNVGVDVGEYRQLHRIGPSCSDNMWPTRGSPLPAKTCA